MMVAGVPGSGIPKYGGLFDAVRTMLRTEGVGAFYKGGTLNAISTPPARGMYMLGVEVAKNTVGGGTVARDFFAGAVAQLISSLAYVPRDVIIERCAIDGQVKSQVGSAASSMQVLRTIMQTEGVAGFYRAYIPHQFVWIPYNGLFFAMLGKINDAEVALGVDNSSYAIGIANSAVCGGAAAWATTPIDVIKTRVQVSGANPELFAFSGAIDCCTKLLKEEGPRALFAGASGRMAYLAPNMGKMVMLSRFVALSVSLTRFFAALFLPLYDWLKALNNGE